MADQDAHMFTPNDNSLKERVTSYREVHKAQQNLRASLRLMDQKAWADRLGSADELADAQKVIDNSLIKASESFSKDELKEAKLEHLLFESEIDSIEKTKHEAAIARRKEQIEQRNESRTNTRTRGRSR